jgi:hypothetical protein
MDKGKGVDADDADDADGCGGLGSIRMRMCTRLGMMSGLGSDGLEVLDAHAWEMGKSSRPFHGI